MASGWMHVLDRSGEEDDARPAGLLLLIRGSLVACALAVVLGAIFGGLSTQLIAGLALVVAQVLALLALRRFDPRKVALLYFWAAWVTVTISIAAHGGILSPLVGGYSLWIIASILFISEVWAFVFAAASSASVLGLIVLALDDRSISPGALALVAIEHGIVLVILTALVVTLSRRVRSSLSQARAGQRAANVARDEVVAIKESLEYLIFARTQELVEQIEVRKQTEQALIEARDAAECGLRARAQFLANMSHEIRTPMNAVIGLTSLLLDTKLDREQRDYLETIRSSGDSLLAIINQILDFSRVESGSVELEEQLYDLDACLEEALDVVGPQAAQKKLELVHRIDPSCPVQLIGDVTRVRQVLVNLLGNAVKFTAEGEVVLDARAVPLGGDQVMLELSVRDTGPGIARDKLDRLFKPFSQIDASTTRRFGGTGLGLAISKKMVELMGGELSVHSVAGEGSCFQARIPCAVALGSRRLVSIAPPPDVLAAKRVLVLPPQGTAGEILTKQLEHWGLAVLRATSDLTAELLPPVDLVIADGRAIEDASPCLLARLRSRKVPLIVLAAWGTKLRDLLVAHALLVPKPMKPARLRAAMIQAISGQADERPTTVAPLFDPATASRHPLRILLAEDNLVNQKVAIKTLSRLGYRADAVANGNEVLTALELQPYDLVLMDVQMPELDGLEATREIVLRYGSARPHIVAMTANAMEGDREACLAAGMDDYVSKPMKVEALTAALARCPQRSRLSLTG